MLRLASSILLFLLISCNALYAETWPDEPDCTSTPTSCHYIDSSATGSADGSDWTNAWTDLPSTFTRGHKYYVADGTYGNHTFNTAVSGSTYIYIKKATVADHGTSTGWSDSKGDGTAEFSPYWTLATSYWVFDGQTRNSDWKSGYGFKITETTSVSDFIYCSAAVHYIKIQYIHFVSATEAFESGETSHGTVTTADTDGKVLTDSTKSWTTNEWVGRRIWNKTDESGCDIGSNTATTVTCEVQASPAIDHLEMGEDNKWEIGDEYHFLSKINQAGIDFTLGTAANMQAGLSIKYNYFRSLTNAINLIHTTGAVVSYNYFDKNHGLSAYGSHAPMTMNRHPVNLTYSYNRFENATGQGAIIIGVGDSEETDSNIKIHNNLFVRGSEFNYNAISNAISGISGAYDIDGLYVYDNTFAGWNVDSGSGIGIAGTGTRTVYVKNNLWYDNYSALVTVSGTATVTRGHNAYLNCSSSGNCSTAIQEPDGAVISQEADDPFTDSSSGDYSLKATATTLIDAGEDLGSEYATDFAGNTRTGSWDIGAYEYGAGGGGGGTTIGAGGTMGLGSGGTITLQ